MGAHEVAHVLHYTQHRNTDALEHLRAAQGIAHRDLLRRGHDDGGADMYRLRERELRGACPRWQVAEKAVELSPVPDEMASTVPRWGSSTGVGGGGTPPGPGRGAGWRGAAPSAALLASVTLTRTPVTPCTPWTAFRTSRASEPGSSRPSRNVNVTIPSPATTRSFTMPAERMSFPLGGFLSWDR